MEKDRFQKGTLHSPSIKYPEEANLHRKTLVLSGGWRRGMTNGWWWVASLFICLNVTVREVDSCNGWKLVRTLGSIVFMETENQRSSVDN